MKDIIEIVKFLEDIGLLLKGVSGTVQNEAREQKGGFLSILLGTLGATLLGNILAGKGINRAEEGVIRAAYGNKRQDYEKKNGFLMSSHPLTDFVIKNINKMNLDLMVFIQEIVYKRYIINIYITNLYEYSDTGTHWVALYVQNNGVTYFDSFRVEHILKEIKTFISNENVKTIFFRIQEYDSIMYGYFYIRFIDFMLAGKTLNDFINLFYQITLKEMMI